MALNFTQKKNVLDLVPNLSEIAGKQRWVSRYDVDTDTMVIRAPQLSRGTEKRYANDEFAFFFNKKSGIEGIFIEYFFSNFMKHNANVKDIKVELTKEIKDEKKGVSSVVSLEPRETKKLISDLESALVNSFVPSIPARDK
jgi:hypothetical protein